MKSHAWTDTTGDSDLARPMVPREPYISSHAKHTNTHCFPPAKVRPQVVDLSAGFRLIATATIELSAPRSRYSHQTWCCFAPCTVEARQAKLQVACSTTHLQQRKANWRCADRVSNRLSIFGLPSTVEHKLAQKGCNKSISRLPFYGTT